MTSEITPEIYAEGEDQTDGSLSYLDIVTAAFGSAIFLLFVFATLPLDQAGGAGATQYIDVQVSYEEDANVELQIVYNDKLLFRTLDPRFQPDPRTGASGIKNPNFKFLHITSIASQNSGDSQEIGFRVLGPAEGKWEVYANAAEQADPFSEESKMVKMTFRHSCAPPCESKDSNGAILSNQPSELVADLQPSKLHQQVLQIEIGRE